MRVVGRLVSSPQRALSCGGAAPLVRCPHDRLSGGRGDWCWRRGRPPGGALAACQQGVMVVLCGGSAAVLGFYPLAMSPPYAF